MLNRPEIIAFLPTINPKVSKEFYMHSIGLDLISEDNFALEFKGDDVTLRITTVRDFSPHPFTVLGFRIKEIATQVKALSKKGVTFKRYETLDQDELGVWISPSTAKVAWFEDPDGNLLSLTECE